jgi:hypothetical protein
MNTKAEIDTAYNELRMGRFLKTRAPFDYRSRADEGGEQEL